MLLYFRAVELDGFEYFVLKVLNKYAFKSHKLSVSE